MNLALLGPGVGLWWMPAPWTWGPVTFSWTVVQSHQDTLVVSEYSFNHNIEQNLSNNFTFSAHGADKIVERLVSFGNVGCSQPRSNGAATVGKDDACIRQKTKNKTVLIRVNPCLKKAEQCKSVSNMTALFYS